MRQWFDASHTELHRHILVPTITKIQTYFLWKTTMIAFVRPLISTYKKEWCNNLVFVILLSYLLAAAHLNAVSRLFEKMSLIRRLQLEPEVMMDMFMKKGFLEHEDKDDRVKEYTGKMSENWQKVNGLIYYQTMENSFLNFIRTMKVTKVCCISTLYWT